MMHLRNLETTILLNTALENNKKKDPHSPATHSTPHVESPAIQQFYPENLSVSELTRVMTVMKTLNLILEKNKRN